MHGKKPHQSQTQYFKSGDLLGLHILSDNQAGPFKSKLICNGLDTLKVLAQRNTVTLFCVIWYWMCEDNETAAGLVKKVRIPHALDYRHYLILPKAT